MRGFLYYIVGVLLGSVVVLSSAGCSSYKATLSRHDSGNYGAHNNLEQHLRWAYK